MKKIYFILAVAAAMLFAAEASAQIGVGVGYNLLNSVRKDADLQDTNELNGFYVEATYDFNFLEKTWGELGIQPGVRFSYAGAHDSDELLGVHTKSSWDETYLDVPVFVKYSRELNKMGLFVFAGPVFSCGLSSDSKVGTNDVVTKINVYERDAYGRFDLKLGVGFGVTCVDKLNVKLGYNFGLLNRNLGEFDLTYRTGVLYAGIGFAF